jgi:EAL domain-containing protein (putative c-di-GMP-specific phosphodiesterase class I)
MYRAKDLGKNNYQFYSDDLSARIFERMTLESHLRHALERNEFVLYYQPQIDTRTQKIMGVEALLRWKHPEFGLVTPNNIVPLMEETGLIEKVGHWALETACRQSRKWHDAGWTYLHLSVNISSRQFNDPDFISLVHDIISTTGINPEYLELELTESMLIRNASATINALNTLSSLGVRFAIDDFGTGYSSLSYLRRFPIDTIKIDRSFIHDVTDNPDDAAIASAIIVMGQNLSLNVIAEGVENQQQLEFLSSRNCHYLQGNLFSRPLPAEEFSTLLRQEK